MPALFHVVVGVDRFKVGREGAAVLGLALTRGAALWLRLVFQTVVEFPRFRFGWAGAVALEPELTRAEVL